MTPTRVVTLVAGALDAGSWRPFGDLPVDEHTPGDTADLEFLLHDGHVNFIGHDRSEVPVGVTGLQCELLNRHDTHTQTLMPMDDDAIIVVAPAEVDFADPAHLDTVRAFLVPRLVPAHLHRGTWHWGPYPARAASVRLFNIQGRGYPQDNAITWLARDLGVAFEVDQPRCGGQDG